MTQSTVPDLLDDSGGYVDLGGGPGQPARRIEGRTPTQLALARLRKDKAAVIAAVVVLILILVAICAPLITKLTGHGPNEFFRNADNGGAAALDPNGIPYGPTSHFLLGGDDQGRDLLARLVYGARVSLTVGLVSTAGCLLIGVVVGLVAGFFGGVIDTVLSRITDIFLSFPSLLFAISLVGVFGQSINLVIYIIIAFSWPTFARITRGQVLSLREKEFVEAARSLGAGNVRIMFIDILPNLMAPLIVYSTLQIPVNIIYESTLSFLGLGVKIPTASWGDTLSAASNFYQVRPTFMIFPILALLITTLSFNLLGDGLRDAFDPRAARTMAK